MNKYTKKSLIFAILSIAVIISGILIFAVAASSLIVTPPESDDPGAALGTLFVALGGFIASTILLVTDIIFSSLFLYTFAYFSHKNAILALEEDTEKAALPKFLRTFSQFEMTLAGIAATAVFIFFIAIMIMTIY
jgi:hypothetical protein